LTPLPQKRKNGDSKLAVKGKL